jgi:hypothetical protein
VAAPAAASLNVPAAHGRHCVDALPAANVPAGHTLHASCGTDALVYWPSAHAAHAVWPAALWK